MNNRTALNNPWRVSVQCSQHIRVQVGDPLLSFLRDTQVAQGALDVWAYNVPVEFCIALAQVTGFLVSELLIEADLLELLEEGRASPWDRDLAVHLLKEVKLFEANQND